MTEPQAPPWTPEEERIILSHPKVTEVQRMLEAAGFTGRTSSAIRQRRTTLRKRMGNPTWPAKMAVAGAAPLVGAEAQLAEALAQRRSVSAQLEALHAQQESLKAERTALATRIHELLEAVREDLEGKAWEAAG